MGGGSYVLDDRQRLGIVPAVVGAVATAESIIKIGENLFGSLFGGGGIDAARKASVDARVRRAMVNPKAIVSPGTDEYAAYMELRCLAGDQSPEVWAFDQAEGDPGTATSCGCGTQACRDYTATMVTNVARASQGNPPLPIPVSSNGQSLNVSVGLPVPLSDVKIFGLPVIPLGIGLAAFAYLAGGSRRGRR